MYRFSDTDGRVIYVGKAKSLRSRLNSYFADPASLLSRTRSMVSTATKVDWTVVPSTWWENSPVVIQEAFHQGRPIIASDIGGMAEKVRDGIDGLHFHVSNPESLAEAMTRAIREPDLWQRLRGGIRPPSTATEAARQHAALFTRLIERRADPMRRAGAR